MKTRLVSDILNEQDILQLYRGMLRDSINVADKSDASAILFSLTDTKGMISDKLSELVVLKFILDDQSNKTVNSFHIQPDGNFGTRMKHAISWAFEMGVEKLIVLGADSPHIPVSSLNTALDTINEDNMVVGPAESAGIYLIGLHRTMNLDGLESVFDELELINLVKLFSEKDKTVKFLPYLQDIDLPADLISMMALTEAYKISSVSDRNFLSKDLMYPKYTMEVISTLGLMIKSGKDNRNLELVKGERDDEYT